MDDSQRVSESESGSPDFHLPLIPDPGKVEEPISSENRSLEFIVSLGTSLARDLDTDGYGHIDLFCDGNSLFANVSSTQNIPSTRLTAHNKSSRFPPRLLPKRGLKKEADSRRVSGTGFLPEHETPLNKFKRVIRAVKTVSGICLALKRYAQSDSSTHWSFLEMYLHVKEDLDKRLAFNPHSFCKIEPERMRLRKLLTTSPLSRTENQIKIILALLRSNASFQDYPVDVQSQLANCMDYQSYEARRVILRQGHRPEAFYIIVSGNVIANVEDRNQKTGQPFVRTVHELGAGDTFGDFDEIILDPLLRQRDDHIDFCKTLPLLRYFPCDKLAENPTQFFYQYFKKGSVVIRDSEDSKHIIIVKAGKCRLISTFTETAQRQRTPDSVSSGDLTQAFPLYTQMQKVNRGAARPKSEGDKLKDSLCIGLMTGTVDRNRLAEYGPDAQLKSSRLRENRDEETKKQRPPIKKSKTLSSFFDKIETERKMVKEEVKNSIEDKFWSMRLRGNSARRRPKWTPDGPRPRSRTPKYTRNNNPFYKETKTAHAQIAELHSGTVFGLESLVQKPSTTFSLISDGAECLFISKRLFLQLANIKVLSLVTDMVQMYPSYEYISQQVHVYRKWQKYKASLIQEVLKRHTKQEQTS